MNESMRTGKAGELRVMSELLLRDFLPSLMLEISEADIILTNNIRIQVKSSHLNSFLGDVNNRYYFSFKSWKRNKEGIRKQEKHKLENVDFIILWAIEENSFFIIPAEVVRKKKSYVIGYTPFPKRKYNSKYNRNWLMQYKNKWDSLKSQGGD